MSGGRLKSTTDDRGPIDTLSGRQLDSSRRNEILTRLAGEPETRAIRFRETPGKAGDAASILLLRRDSDLRDVLANEKDFPLTPYDDALGAVSRHIRFFLSADTEEVAARREMRSKILGHSETVARADDLGMRVNAREAARATVRSLDARSKGETVFDVVREVGFLVPYLIAVRAFAVTGPRQPSLRIHLLQLLRVWKSGWRWFRLSEETQAMQSLLQWTLLPTGHIFANFRNRDAGLRGQAKWASESLEAEISRVLKLEMESPSRPFYVALKALHDSGEMDQSSFDTRASGLVYEFVGSVLILVGQGFARTLQYMRASGTRPDQLPGLLAEPDLAEAWINEALRLHSPTGMLQRTCPHGASLGDMQVSPGEHVIMAVDLASRDPASRIQPGAFAPDSDPGAYLHFGNLDGDHPCFGQGWARAIIREMLLALAELPGLDFIGSPDGDMVNFAGFPESMRMRFDAGKKGAR